jgi:cell division protein FtsW
LIKKLTPFVFFSSLTLTGLTLIPSLSQRIHGSSRWLRLCGIPFQPSELLKISLIIYLSFFLVKKAPVSSSFINSFAPLLSILGAVSYILLKQPDFGLTVTLLCTVFCVLFITNFQTKNLLITVSLFIPATLYLIYLKPYRLQRVLTFLNPWADPQGSGFQIIQSLIAIGSGNVWGVGISHSKQKFFYLPMQHTDFIFSIIAEEIGFFGSLLLILLYILFIYFGLRIALKLSDRFSLLTVLGYIIFTSLQTIINLSVATGLAPTKGVGLPFISYGNSALISNLIMVGLIINMVHHNDETSSLYTL